MVKWYFSTDCLLSIIFGALPTLLKFGITEPSPTIPQPHLPLSTLKSVSSKKVCSLRVTVCKLGIYKQSLQLNYKIWLTTHTCHSLISNFLLHYLSGHSRWPLRGSRTLLCSIYISVSML